MMTRLLVSIAALGLVGGMSMNFAQSPASEQSSKDTMNEGKSNSKETQQEIVDRMKVMSAEDKAALYDNMLEKDKMASMKSSGHDMSKMTSRERADMMMKMSTQEKADAFEKMPMKRRTAAAKNARKMEKVEKRP